MACIKIYVIIFKNFINRIFYLLKHTFGFNPHTNKNTKELFKTCIFVMNKLGIF